MMTPELARGRRFVMRARLRKRKMAIAIGGCVPLVVILLPQPMLMTPAALTVEATL